MPRRLRNVLVDAVDGLAGAHVGVRAGQRERLLPQRAEQLDADVRRRVVEVAQRVGRRAVHVHGVADPRRKERRRIRQRAVGPRDIERSAQTALRRQWFQHLQPREARGFRFLGQRRRREEPGAHRSAARPSSAARQDGDPRTEERPVLAVSVESSARGERYRGRDVVVELAERARDHEGVRQP